MPQNPLSAALFREFPRSYVPWSHMSGTVLCQIKGEFSNCEREEIREEEGRGYW